ncbi:hypothetical protein PGT21_050201 [Puccinia graminis f. sp. tritici]|uniref:Reverse transcriptase domain-containing protein n=1 Tax=Puccinia graminis f. sp. tritici TaxID=56615 RepID=A0A5B0PJB2_PUCGR|nr:hypothetical protein PGT21_050201 [Puccinia graminis f. sp. tritici]
MVAGLFLDVKSAYPSVHPARLIQYLFHLKCPTYLVLMITDFLKDRSTTIRLDDFTSEAFPIHIGLPQGSPLSVILYILYNNSLLKKSFAVHLDSVSIGYVDDVVHLVAANTAEEAKAKLAEEGRRSLKWGDTHGAIFNQAKAQFMWLTKGETPIGDFLFGNQRLTPATEVKWLGVWLDKKLLFNRNLSAKVNRLAGIFTLGVFKSTSNEFIRKRSAVPDFADEVVKTSFSFFFRKLVMIKPNNIIRSFILSSRAESTLRLADSAKIGLAAGNVDCALKLDPERIHLSFDFGSLPSRALDYVNLDKSKEAALLSVKSLVSAHDSDPSSLMIFSDGTYHPEKGGAGAAVCPALNVFSSFSLGNDSLVSNHESEAVGILAALGLAKELVVELEIRHILIFLDNQGVIRRTNDPLNPKPGQRIFKEIDKTLSELPCGLKMSFVWCPGHRDILGNELADELAKEAVDSPTSQNLKIKSNYKKVHRQVMANHQPRNSIPSNLNIACSSLINQLASGHCTLKTHLFRIRRSLDPLCPNCGARETVFHFMNFCPQAKIQRAVLRRHLRSLCIYFNAGRLDLTLGNRKAEEAVASFLQASNRFPEHLSR